MPRGENCTQYSQLLRILSDLANRSINNHDWKLLYHLLNVIGNISATKKRLMSLRVIELIDLHNFLTAILHCLDDMPPDILEQVCWLNF